MFRLCAAVLLVLVAAAGLTRWIEASDHKDSALLAADHAADIADVYTFRSPVHPDNVVLVMTVSGFIPPSEASTTFFDPGVLYQWKLDNNGDAIEDLVIQAFDRYRRASGDALPWPGAGVPDGSHQPRSRRTGNGDRSRQ